MNYKAAKRILPLLITAVIITLDIFRANAAEKPIEMEVEAVTQSETAIMETETAEKPKESEQFEAETEIISDSESETRTETMSGAETESEAPSQVLPTEAMSEAKTEVASEIVTEIMSEAEVATEAMTEVMSEEATTEAVTEIATEEALGSILGSLQEELERRAQENGYTTSGYIDAGFEADEVSAGDGQIAPYHLFRAANQLPVAYSAVENGQVSTVKDQGAWGTCWAFAAISSAESSYKKLNNREADLSESQLVNFFYNDSLTGPDGGLEGDGMIPLTASKTMQGGNNAFTTFAMARWTGIVDEALDKSLVYPVEESKNTKELDISSEYAYQDALHMQNAYWINKNNMDEIKKAVMEYGSVSMYYKYSDYNDSAYVDIMLDKYGLESYTGPAVYYYTSVPNEEGHAVSIVGWDDNFNRNHFAYTFINQQEILSFKGEPELPEYNGAWLVKNSWGDDYGDAGYFWMSYEDASISKTMFVFDFENADNYDHIYQYDGAAGVRYEGAGEGITTAAVYTVPAGTESVSQTIKAVGIGIASVNTDYTVKVYTDLVDRTKPDSGRLRRVVKGSTAFQGYYTIPLERSLSLKPGEEFAIVVALKNGMVDGENQSAIFIDHTYVNANAVRFQAAVHPGETFRKIGANWEDAYNRAEPEQVQNADKLYRGTYRIKAYSTDGDNGGNGEDDEDLPSPDEITWQTMKLSKLKISLDASSKTAVYNGEPHKPEVLIEGLTQGQDFSVTYRNVVNAGKATVTVTGLANVRTGIRYEGTKTFYFTIKKAKLSDTLITYTDTYHYTGKPVTLDNLEVSLNLNNIRYVLKAGRDYSVSYKNNIKAGSNIATATIKGSNINFSGSRKCSFTINPLSLADIPDSAVSFLEYSPNGAKLKSIAFQDIVLTEGTDYKAKYTYSDKKKKSIGSTVDIVITGKNACAGTSKEFRNVRIEKAAFSNCIVTPTELVFDVAKTKRSVKVKNYAGVSLKENRDYRLEWSIAERLGELQMLTIIPLNTECYTGTKEVAYRTANSIARVKGLTISEQVYNGVDPVELSAEAINGLEEGDFEVLSYKNNMRAGTATVVIQGAGRYYGKKTLRFRIIDEVK